MFTKLHNKGSYSFNRLAILVLYDIWHKLTLLKKFFGISADRHMDEFQLHVTISAKFSTQFFFLMCGWSE